MRRFAVLAVALSGLIAGFAMPAQAEEPQVSREMAKPLKAVQEAIGAKQYAEAIAKAKEANAMSGKSAYDQYIINEFLLASYAAQGNYADAVPYIEANLSSPYAPPAAKAQRIKTLMNLYYQLKNYGKVVEYGLQSRAGGDNSNDTVELIANSYYLLGKYKDAMNTKLELVNRAEESGGRPDEKALRFVWDCANKLKDDAMAGRIVEKLVMYYPKPDYWQYATVSLRQAQAKGSDDRLTLNIYRLMNDVGIMNRGEDYTEAAQIALDEGNPGEAYAYVQTAFSKNLYTEKRDQDKNQRLLDMAKSKAAADRANIAKYEADAAKLSGGDGLVQIGAAYLGFGQPEKAEAAISSGIAKGNLKYADEAYLLLGIADLRQKKMEEARKAFGKVTGDAKYTRLAKLWALRTR